MSDYLLKDLCNDYAELLNCEDGYDVIVKVGKTPDFKEFHAHANILRARSGYFRTNLTKDRTRKEDGCYVIAIPDMTPKIFETLLRYMYAGLIDLSTQRDSDALQLLTFAEKLDLQSLVTFCQDHLITHCAGWLTANLMDILQFVSRYHSLGKLKNFCLQKVVENPASVFYSDKLSRLDESIFGELIERDDMGMEEVDVWLQVIRWGTSRVRNLNTKNKSEWSRDDFAELERVLHNLLPKIRFFDISSQDYYDKVRPYKKILPKDLKEQLLHHYLKPDSTQPSTGPRESSSIITSTLITHAHAALISEWIDGSNSYEVPETSKHRYKLLYRGSRDGFSAQSFHEKCDNSPGTIVLIKPSGNSGIILGGFNPNTWNNYILAASQYYNSNQTYQYSNETFIFSFNVARNDSIAPQLSRVHMGNQAIGCGPGWGPYFYDDLMTSDNCNSNSDSWYQHMFYKCDLLKRDAAEPKSRWHFKVEDYEVFHVLKNVVTEDPIEHAFTQRFKRKRPYNSSVML
ncbi:7054_t:CDS:2 [Paraglomus occultum]|uniref:7054_t:CDS:1 n=1 Tax=Paraglomus occultum TaxID=144539 RepID=A0A9N8ZMX6_9GLOM|nr:7054_t:CDS:2 [Paraglomus occultum]